MLISVGTSSQRLDQILTADQKAQIYNSLPKNSPERTLTLKVKTSGRTIHIENGADATEANSMPLKDTDQGITVLLSGLSDYSLIADTADTEVYLLQG